MTVRLVLVSPALSEALREARFDDGRPLDPVGLRRAREAAGTLPGAGPAFVSPTVRCRETAAAMGLDAVEDPALAALDAGHWRGETLAEVGAREPAALAAWLGDPGAAPHGGESVRAVCDRTAAWLDALPERVGRAVAVIEPELVRAAVVRALGAPDEAFWRADVPPLTAVELSGRAGRWNVRMGRPLAPLDGDT
ncbi:histidine phosphatase family protein [Streptomyces sp. bgisy153]|uniref:histidine phosphatase family protein n=1 Tax=Streptomyces sp. bgisy153 TaxID=3413793 RepID=UPI003D72B116